MKILSSKVAAGVMFLLFLMETSVRPSEACRVLIKGLEGEQAHNKEPSLIVLQTLQKGKTPSPGNSGGYTPRSSTTASTTGTKAFAGRSDVGVPPRDHSGRVPWTGVAAERI
ncbi:BHLH domain-containing protein [Psidium guajava]|nr:BHLH domain-containing protein [Psidium guajava]